MNPERRLNSVRRNIMSGAAAFGVIFGACTETQTTAVPQAFKNNCRPESLQTIKLNRDFALEARLCGNQTGVILVNRTPNIKSENSWVDAAFSPSGSQSVSDTFTYKSGDNKKNSSFFQF